MYVVDVAGTTAVNVNMCDESNTTFSFLVCYRL